ncbi:Serine carboxypeptidase-like 42 [Asimina triloba]
MAADISGDAASFTPMDGRSGGILHVRNSTREEEVHEPEGEGRIGIAEPEQDLDFGNAGQIIRVPRGQKGVVNAITAISDPKLRNANASKIPKPLVGKQQSCRGMCVTPPLTRPKSSSSDFHGRRLFLFCCPLCSLSFLEEGKEKEEKSFGEMFWRVCGILLVGFCALGGVAGYPEEDRVLNLPGQPKVHFRQYAGYVVVDEEAGRSLFYYFAEAYRHAHSKPLTLWLNGGPGCSSIGGGAFTELGPFFPRGNGLGLRKNHYSWNKVSNLLFVESPAGVGWSYSNRTSDLNTGDARTAEDMYKFLLGWFEKFPKYKSRALFLTGESYAGHYIPQLADLLLQHNNNSTDFKFNLRGVAIGNPLLNLDRDISSTYEFYWSHGLISDEIRLAIMNKCDFEDYTFDSPYPGKPNNLSLECNNAIGEANQVVGDYINPYDVILDVCYPSIVKQELLLKKYITKISVGVDVCMSIERKFYLNLPEVQRALHANRTNLPYEWSMCSDNLLYNYADGNINIVPILKRIVQNGIPVWVFSGDQDSVVPLLGSRTVVRELAQELNFQVTVPYASWFYRGQVGGWVTEYGKLLTFATVRGASHMVPYSQPGRALLLFKSFIFGINQRLSYVSSRPSEWTKANEHIRAGLLASIPPIKKSFYHPPAPPPPPPPPPSKSLCIQLIIVSNFYSNLQCLLLKQVPTH